MGKSKPAPPPAPDYTAAANAQGAANVKAGESTASLSNPNVYSPYGNQIVSYDATGPGGAMQPTIRQTLTPEAQKTLDAQQRVQYGLANLGEQGLGQAGDILSHPFSYQGPGVQTSLGPLQSAQTSLGDYGQANGNLDLSGVAKIPVNAGMTGQQAIMARLNPQIQQNDAAFKQQLANQGLVPGSEAYDNAMRNQTQGNNDLYSQAALQGLGLDFQANQQGFNEALQSGQFGNAAQQQNFGQGLQRGQFANEGIGQNYNQALGAAQFGNTAVAQNLQHQLGIYNQPLNSINALMSGSQIQAPQFQQYSGANIEAAPIANATAQQGTYNQGIYGQQMAGYNSGMGALGSLAGAAGMFAMSDIRLKSNIVRVGTHPLGIGIYDYDIFGRRERGVMAQELETIMPDAVITLPNGYKAVNYGAL